MAQTGVIILAHGSRSKQTINEILGIFDAMVHRVRAILTPEVEVEWAALQFNHPNLEEAAESLIARGIEKVVILPYFLFPGRHVVEDIPSFVEELRQTYPEVQFLLANALGVEESLIDLVVKRIQEAAPELSPRHSFSVTYYAPQSIETHSMAIIEDLLPPLDCSEEECQVIKRIVHATGDPQIASLVRFHPDAVSAGIDAIGEGKSIFTDVRMVSVGINHSLAQEFGCSIHCALDEPGVTRQTQEESITRSAAAIRCLGSRLNGAIVAIGNAPTALLTLLDLIGDGGVMPALVVGMPVGFVQASESKSELMKQDIPYITIEGTRGGSAAAVATVNAVLKLAKSVKF
ncbi:MAG: precorrin-8X methylmutase [Dehalococcoidia bacterium]|nr:Cobalt-precorrin-8 methylmutase [Chloroflexota bacterium]